MKTMMLVVLGAVLLIPVNSVAQVTTSADDHRLLARAASALGRTQGSVAAPQTAKPENWISRHLVVVGTLVGAGAGTVMAANVERGFQPAIALAGALGGGYGGLVATAIHKAKRNEPVPNKIKFGIVAGAIGVGAASLITLRGLGGV